jgi:hypothetical protein
VSPVRGPERWSWEGAKGEVEVGSFAVGVEVGVEFGVGVAVAVGIAVGVGVGVGPRDPKCPIATTAAISVMSPARIAYFLRRRRRATAIAARYAKAPVAGTLEGAALHPAQPPCAGADEGSGGAGDASVGATVAVAVGSPASDGPPSSVLASIAATVVDAASKGIRLPVDSRLSGGIAPRTNDASDRAPTRGKRPIFDAAFTSGAPLDQGSRPGGPPHTPRAGFLHAIGPVHGWRMT